MKRNEGYTINAVLSSAMDCDGDHKGAGNTRRGQQRGQFDRDDIINRKN